MRTLVACSGGLKSAFLISLAQREDYHAPNLVYFQRGSIRDESQWRAVKSLAKHYSTQCICEAMPDGTHAPNTLEDLTYMTLKLLQVAREQSCQRILIGWGKTNWYFTVYRQPQLIEQYLTAMQTHFNLMQTTATPIAIEMPLYYLDPLKIVFLGQQYGVPWFMTYTCSHGTPFHCGQCATCQERQRLFFKANVTDATIYIKPQIEEIETDETFTLEHRSEYQ